MIITMVALLAALVGPLTPAKAERLAAANQLPKDERVLIVDDGSTAAAETVLRLRLKKYQAHGVEPSTSPQLPTATSSSTPTSTATAISPEVQKPWHDAPPWVFVVVGFLVLSFVALLVWFFILLPNRRAKPLREAMGLLATSDDPPLQRIESLLNRAASSGLRAADLENARFLLAFVRASLGRHSDALAVLGECLLAKSPPVHVLYLDLWLKVKSGAWEESERRWHDSSATLDGYLHSRHLAGIVFLERGRQSLLSKEYDAALGFFEKVRALGVLTDRIPGHLSNLELVLALGALFEHDAPLAAQRFERVREKAESAGGSTLLPRIGLLLCSWQSESAPDIDQQLGAILGEVEAAAAKSTEKTEATELLPPLTLWFAASLLFRCLQLPERKGLPDADRGELMKRLDRVRERMPDSGDADLIAGLVDYFCAKNDNARRAAVALLRKAVDAGVTLPEILYLVESEERLAFQDKNKVETYLSLVKSFFTDPAVSIDVRQGLHEHLRQFERFRSVPDLVVPADDGAIAPSLHDVAASCALVEDRVRRLFRGLEEDAVEQGIDELLRNLNGSRDALQRTVEELGQIEQQLMQSAGEALLPDTAPAMPPLTGE